MLFDNFEPDYTNILDASYNKKAKRLPLYEHIVSVEIMEKILNQKIKDLIKGDVYDKKEYFKAICSFWKKTGYDTVSYEGTVVDFIQQGQALCGIKTGIIKNESDLQNFDFKGVIEKYFDFYTEHFDILSDVMPKGMKIIGGVGNGVFEIAEDFVGYEGLCMMRVDEPEVYKKLFSNIGDMLCAIWKEILIRYKDIIAIPRFGDDLGYKSSTMLMPDDIRNLIIPEYKKIVSLIRSFDKPFLWHSCGCIFEIMEDILREVPITAKHSNEDQIAPITKWIDDYNERIGIFGGVDIGVL